MTITTAGAGKSISSAMASLVPLCGWRRRSFRLVCNAAIEAMGESKRRHARDDELLCRVVWGAEWTAGGERLRTAPRPPTVTSYEFGSEAACVAAKRAIEGELDKRSASIASFSRS